LKGNRKYSSIPYSLSTYCMQAPIYSNRKDTFFLFLGHRGSGGKGKCRVMGAV
jgi:hypothetical protein